MDYLHHRRGVEGKIYFHRGNERTHLSLLSALHIVAEQKVLFEKSVVQSTALNNTASLPTPTPRDSGRTD